LSSQKTPAHHPAAASHDPGLCFQQIPPYTRLNQRFTEGYYVGRSAGLVTDPRGARSVRRLADLNKVTRSCRGLQTGPPVVTFTQVGGVDVPLPPACSRQDPARRKILLPSQTSGSYLRSTTRSLSGMSALSVILMCSGQTSVQHLVMLQ